MLVPCWYKLSHHAVPQAVQCCWWSSSCGEGCATAGNFILTFIHWTLLSNLTVDILIKQRKNLLLFFCLTRSFASVFPFLVWYCAAVWSLLRASCQNQREIHSLKVVWTARGASNSLIFQRNLYMREDWLFACFKGIPGCVPNRTHYYFLLHTGQF